MQRFFSIVALSALLTTAAHAEDADHEVDQKKLQFSVEDLTISKGEKVKFLNSDRTPHNILINNGGMMENSGMQRPGEDVVVEFAKAGVYNVMCGIHPKMKLKIEVN